MASTSIYTLLSGMKSQEGKMDDISNNLANVTTPGYKKDQRLFREYYTKFAGQDLQSEEDRFANESFLSPEDKGIASFVAPDSSYIDRKQGNIQFTGQKFDMALTQPGFFSIETPLGERYTRNGTFMKNEQDYLVTSTGDKVLGEKGAIRVLGENLRVSEIGEVFVDNVQVDKLKIVDFPAEAPLTKLGNSYYALAHSSKFKPHLRKDISVQQGSIERSNVDTVNEMVNMITANRSYEAAQRAMQSVDSLDQESITIARI